MKWIYYLMIFVSLSWCAEQPHSDVTGFINLLVRQDEPTLLEYSKFVGDCGGESELLFTLHKCKLLGFDEMSQQCIILSNQECKMVDILPSHELSWTRKKFATI